MKIIQTEMNGLLLLEPDIFLDDRGIFCETYNEYKFENSGISTVFPLECQSQSKKGVIRGMHFQQSPHAQGKLVRVVKGCVLDVVVDVRKASKTYKKWESFLLDDTKNKMLWIPDGFAHGFLSLKDDTIMLYKIDAPYVKDSEGIIAWNDKEINIDWRLDEFEINNITLSEKDNLVFNNK